ncbi:DUF5337 domain-containing protein [Paracoccus tegillarcae]|uniref:DUF5337 domain-containing protein n=1 Tax=Paracoccus tegillarcae TaxID=1529068 RepID=A0A2K9EJ59_9RHOB|nr:DUF5337 domain-containing protein [Paracoccus tegillarcae]AUH35030.1 hypothetical protein CUV01_18085 [Paracoccus tegillarcae]
MSGEGDHSDSTQMRLAAVVIAVAMIGWIVLQWIGKEYGWAPRWVFLVDLAAIGGFVWSLLVTWRIWRRKNG